MNNKDIRWLYIYRNFYLIFATALTLFSCHCQQSSSIDGIVTYREWDKGRYDEDGGNYLKCRCRVKSPHTNSLNILLYVVLFGNCLIFVDNEKMMIFDISTTTLFACSIHVFSSCLVCCWKSESFLGNFSGGEDAAGKDVVDLVCKNWRYN
jgi:hypothetical protein